MVLNAGVRRLVAFPVAPVRIPEEGERGFRVIVKAELARHRAEHGC
jgi:hypothetical protein